MSSNNNSHHHHHHHRLCRAINYPVTINHSIDYTGQQTYLNGPVDIYGRPTISGLVTFNGPLTVQGEVVFTDPVVINGSVSHYGRLNLIGPVTIHGPVLRIGDGGQGQRRRRRRRNHRRRYFDYNNNNNQVNPTLPAPPPPPPAPVAPVEQPIVKHEVKDQEPKSEPINPLSFPGAGYSLTGQIKSIEAGPSTSSFQASVKSEPNWDQPVLSSSGQKRSSEEEIDDFTAHKMIKKEH